MESTAAPHSYEKAALATATAPNVVVDDPAKEPEEVYEYEKNHEPSGEQQVDDSDAAEEHHDIEQANTTTSSAPPYSIFSPRRKMFIVFMTAWGAFFSPLSANIYFPALNVLATDLSVSNSLINLTLTSYMIFQGLAPTVVGDFADMAGRRPLFIVGFTIYIGACIGIALQDSFAALFVLRCLQSSGSSGTVALASGVVADISTSSERGTYMGWATTGMLLGPAVGPIVGGVLAQFLGWRSIFWFLIIMAGIFLVPYILLVPETARNVVGNGSVPPQGWNMSVFSYLAVRKAAKQEGADSNLQRTVSRASARSAREALAAKRKFRWPNPLRTVRVVFEKDMGLLLFYNSIVYTAFYDITASTPYLFAQIYGYNELQIGLSFLPFGFGCLIAPVINGRLLDWNFRRVARKAGIIIDKKRGNVGVEFPLELARVPLAWPLVLVGDACLLCYGWAMQAETSVAVPLVLQFIMGLTLTGSFNVMTVMLVDNYPMSPATAVAANNLVRCLMGAGGTAVIIYMIDAMGRGWCFTFIAAVVFVTSPILPILMKYGPQWRKERMLREEAKKTSEGSQ